MIAVGAAVSIPLEWGKKNRMEDREMRLAEESLGLAQAGSTDQGRQHGCTVKPKLEAKTID